jgi:hypothetical protein
VSRTFLEVYRKWLDIFFDDPFIRLTVLAVDQSSTEWQRFSPRSGSRDDKLASVFYQYLLVTFQPLSDNRRWWVFPDEGLFSRDEVLDRVEFLFNRTYKKAFGPKTSRIIRLVRSQDSAQSQLIQLADVCVASVACAHLGKMPDSEAKRQQCD